MALVVRNVSISFGGTLAVDAMDLDVAANEIVGLIGPNGAGKTTFINCISGTYRPNSGSALWDESNLIGREPYELLRLGVARTFQNVASLHGLSILDLVKLGANMRGDLTPSARLAAMFRSEKAVEEELIETLLQPLKLADLAHQPIQTLSYGHRKGVDLARALASKPELLLLDEPVAGMTSQESMVMAGLIRDVRERLGCAVIMVEHKMDVVNSTCDRITVMASGTKIFSGSPEEVQRDPEVRRVYLGEE